VVLIGVGGWGKNHARILSQLGVLTAICDADDEKRKEFGKKYSVNNYKNFNEMLESETFDTAFVCTPTNTHYQIATQLIQEKKNVFVEKPMTHLSEEGQKLIELAKKNKVILTCGYIERFNPAVSLVKNYVLSKKYGELLKLEFHRENRLPNHIRDVGIIHDTSVHDIDMAMWLFDDTPEIVFARAGQIKHEHEDFATIMLGFKDDRTATISLSWITPARVRNFSATCTGGIIFSDFISQDVIIKTENNTEMPKKEKKEPLLLEIQNFLDAVDGRNEILVNPQHAVNVTKVAEAALLSSQKGTPIYLDLR